LRLEKKLRCSSILRIFSKHNFTKKDLKLNLSF